jgi:hypothetical protein
LRRRSVRRNLLQHATSEPLCRFKHAHCVRVYRTMRRDRELRLRAEPSAVHERVQQWSLRGRPVRRCQMHDAAGPVVHRFSNPRHLRPAGGRDMPPGGMLLPCHRTDLRQRVQ